MTARVLIGRYTTPEQDRFGDEHEPLDGIRALRLEPDGRLVPESSARAANASFLALRDGMLVALQERRDGSMLAVDSATLEAHASPIAVGEVPGHLAFAPDGAVLVANYGGGTVVAVEPGRGVVLAELPLPASPGPVVERQEAPHPHHVLHLGGDRWAVCDLGSDAVLEVAWTGEALVELRRAVLPPGAGPRHAARHGDRLYVTGELDSRVHVLDAGTWEPIGSVPASAAPAEANDPSHLMVVGDRLYVANRGADTIAVFELDGGLPRLLQETPTGGHWPRHFAITAGRLMVANERSGAVVVHELRPDGTVGAELGRHTLPWPACVLID